MGFFAVRRRLSFHLYWLLTSCLVAFWGAAIVLFLAKMINLHNKDRQDFWVEISSQVENGRSHERLQVIYP